MDRRRVNDLREETRMQFSINLNLSGLLLIFRIGRVVRGQIMWANHLVQVEEARLPKKAEAVKHSGRPQLRGRTA